MIKEKVDLKRKERAVVFSRSGGIHAALADQKMDRKADLTLSEALILGLIEQGVRTFFAVFGHGSTEIGEVLRVYQETGLVKVFGVRSEIEASHAATALRWVTGEKAAVITSIGPGALQAMAASIVAASDGIGVWYLFGDETTHDEGFNMQQVPKHEQSSFLKLMSGMGRSYTLHTPEAVSSALRFGSAVVDHPYRQGPFFLLLPMNTQATLLREFNLDELPECTAVSISAADGDYDQAMDLIRNAKKILVKVGGGAIHSGSELIKFLERTNGVLVHTPIATGCIPYLHPANMGVGGSKGSICGNFAMENADLLIAVGTRAVCQSDCSRTGYPKVKHVININMDVDDALHYNRTLALIGDAEKTLQRLNNLLNYEELDSSKSNWRAVCAEQKRIWQGFKEQRRVNPVLFDDYWQKDVLTQPAAILTAIEWAKTEGIKTFFDAGDVQANGFQLTEDERPGVTFTETGASYMGFGVSALLATSTSRKPFYGLAITGDGSLTMNPQILIDGVEHKAKGCILLLDNGRMAAISGLQTAQYGKEFATWNTFTIDYTAWAKAIPGLLGLHGGYTISSLHQALETAKKNDGLTLIHLPVYYGHNPLGGMGVYGRWNVGNWCEATQALRHDIGL